MEESEYSRVARDHAAGDRWLRRLPLIAAALGALPLLWLSVQFSLLIGQIGFYVVGLGTDTWTIVGLALLTLAGFVSLLGTLVCLWVGTRRRTWRWRVGWALGALACAALLPVSWLLFGLTGPA